MTDPVNILLVDDNRENLVALRATLEAPGHHLVEAKSGVEALRACLERPFALVLLDVHMPGLDGLETAKLLRDHPRTQHTPIIFLTGFESDRAKVMSAYSLGAVDYLIKPFDPLLLTAKVAVFVDLHREKERVRAETERRIVLARVAEELARSNRELDHFAGIASHELQQPLRTIATYARLLQTEYAPALDDDAMTYLEFMVQGARRMKETIDGLLAYARIGAHDRIRSNVSCAEIVREVIDTLRPQIEQSDAVLHVAPLPSVHGDHLEIRRLFQNLLANALKFRSHRPPVIQISATREGALWQFCIADNGIGIDPEHHGRIFEVFTRLHAYDELEGAGIGLSECAKIVKQHGGTIAVESTLGDGARFSFTLSGAR